MRNSIETQDLHEDVDAKPVSEAKTSNAERYCQVLRELCSPRVTALVQQRKCVNTADCWGADNRDRKLTGKKAPCNRRKNPITLHLLQKKILHPAKPKKSAHRAVMCGT